MHILTADWGLHNITPCSGLSVHLSIFVAIVAIITSVSKIETCKVMQVLLASFSSLPTVALLRGSSDKST